MADGSIIIDTSIDSSGAKKGIKNLTSEMASMASDTLGVVTKTTAAMVTVATGAVASLTTLSIKQFAEYEQLVGGVDTLFKENSMQVQMLADDAFKTAGLSANQYMETITGFTASLLQGLGGDTAKAAEIGNRAVIDMSDNANKMGTRIKDIQNAYQGFAKQNYTMLDNLKLGYGGTKAEMERLLVDAGKLSGMKYSIENFSDIIEAIHVIQTELDITGTTALEASTTIEGSFNTMKAAWSNMLRVLGDDSADFEFHMDNLLSSIGVFGENILPRIKIVLEGIGIFAGEIAQKLPGVIMEILPQIIDAGINVLGSFVSSIMDALPELIDLAYDMIVTLLTGIQNALPNMSEGGFEIINTLLTKIVELLPQILQTGIDIIMQLVLGLADTLPTLIPIAIEAILTLVDTLLDNIDNIIDAGIKLLIALADGLIAALPDLIDKIPIIIEKLLTAIANNLPKLLEAGVTLIVKLAEGLVQAIPQLLSKVPALITALLNAIASYYKNLFERGAIMVQKIVDGLFSMVGSLLSAGGSIIGSLINSVTSAISGFFNIGKNIVEGIWNGIASMGSWIADKFSGFFSGVVNIAKKALGIHSPSRVFKDEVGKYMAQGIGVGFEDEFGFVEDSIYSEFNSFIEDINLDAVVDMASGNVSRAVVGGTNITNNYSTIEKNSSPSNSITQNVTIVNPQRTPSENARALKKQWREMGYA